MAEKTISLSQLLKPYRMKKIKNVDLVKAVKTKAMKNFFKNRLK